MRPEHAIADNGRPYTGAEYMQSLRDGREVYIDGERVADVTTHPAFRNSVRTIARLYDALHDPARQGVLTCPTDTGSGGYTHRYFRVARSREDLVGAQGAIAAWSRLSYGWMGRTPDYKAAYTNTLGANPEYYGPYADNARAWYKRAQETVPFMNHAIVNPPVDRHKPAEQVKDVFVSVEKEVDGGIIVSGAKVVATSAAMTHYNYMGQSSKTATEDLDMSLMFIVPIDAPGLKLFCRTSYELASVRHGTPFDYPLSSRFDENDAIIVLDKVFVPWEDVFIYRDPARVLSFYPRSGFMPGFLFQGCTRFAVKLDFLCGLLSKALRCTGGDDARGNQTLLGEAVAWRNLFWSLSNAMANNPDPWKDGAVLPEPARGAGLSRVRARRLPAHQGHYRAHGDVGPDLPAVLSEGFRQPRHRALPAPVRARIVRHRLRGPDQGDETAVGRGWHRVRWAARIVRTQLCRRMGGYQVADFDRRAAWRRHGGNGIAGRAMHGRL